MVKILSRDAINRMVGRKSSVAGVGGGGGDVDLSGYATKIWTQETFVSIDFFRSLFRAYDSQNHEILPNDTDSTIDNIKAMFGFWTEQYISALGQGTGGGGGGVGDVTWDLLANNSDTRQIALSHLTTALSGYVTTSDISNMATQTWVTNNYLTQTAASSTYLTQTAASSTYLTKTAASSTYLTKTAASSTYLSIAFFNRLFQAYAGTGSSAVRVNPNDTTSTIDNIKAMFGFWTEQYLSALGQNSGGGGGIVLSEPLQSINNASLGTPQSANVGLVWNGTAWTYGTTGGSASSVSWNNVSNKPTTIGGYGITDCKIAGGTITIGTNSITPITSHQSLSGYAKETWVDNNYLSRNGGTVKGDLQLKRDNSNYGCYLVFGDRPSSGKDYAYLGENSDDHMVLYGKRGVLVQAGGTGGASGRLILESLVQAADSGIDIACNGDSYLRLVSEGTDNGTIEIKASHNIPLYTTNETAVVQLQDWSSNGTSWLHNAGSVSIRTKNGNITLNPSNGNTEVYNFVNRSDIRNKNIVEYIDYDLSFFSNSPLFTFTWKSNDDQRLHIGTSAQYWNSFIPEVVFDILEFDKKGRVIGEHLSLDYITLSYIGVVMASRKLSNHEEEIQLLKTRVKALEEENKELKMKLKIA